MTATTKDLRVIASLANLSAPQQEGKNKANKRYYIGQACVKDGNGRLDDPSTGNAALYVLGVFVEATEGFDGMDAAANDELEFTLHTGEFMHFKNSGANPIGATAAVGTLVYFEDNQTVGTLNTAGSKGAVFLGWEKDNFNNSVMKIGVGPQYWKA